MRSFIFCLWLSILAIPMKCNNPNRRDYPVMGIDMSHHQGRVNWDKIKAAKVAFIYMKATEGGDYKDSMFVFNWALAKTLAFKRGAYHFFTFCRSGDEQARNFLETVKIEDGDLPPVLDLEFGGNCSKKIFTKEQLIEEMQEFLYVVEKSMCAKPILYTTNTFYKEYIKGRFPGYQIWIRDILTRPSLPDDRDWTFWQYKVDTLHGVDGDVDLNVFNGDSIEFQKLLISGCEEVMIP